MSKPPRTDKHKTAHFCPNWHILDAKEKESEVVCGVDTLFRYCNHYDCQRVYCDDDCVYACIGCVQIMQEITKKFPSIERNICLGYCNSYIIKEVSYVEKAAHS